MNGIFKKISSLVELPFVCVLVIAVFPVELSAQGFEDLKKQKNMFYLKEDLLHLIDTVKNQPFDRSQLETDIDDECKKSRKEGSTEKESIGYLLSEKQKNVLGSDFKETVKKRVASILEQGSKLPDNRKEIINLIEKEIGSNIKEHINKVWYPVFYTVYNEIEKKQKTQNITPNASDIQEIFFSQDRDRDTQKLADTLIQNEVSEKGCLLSDVEKPLRDRLEKTIEFGVKQLMGRWKEIRSYKTDRFNPINIASDIQKEVDKVKNKQRAEAGNPQESDKVFFEDFSAIERSVKIKAKGLATGRMLAFFNDTNPLTTQGKNFESATDFLNDKGSQPIKPSENNGYLYNYFSSSDVFTKALKEKPAAHHYCPV